MGRKGQCYSINKTKNIVRNCSNRWCFAHHDIQCKKRVIPPRIEFVIKMKDSCRFFHIASKKLIMIGSVKRLRFAWRLFIKNNDCAAIVLSSSEKVPQSKGYKIICRPISVKNLWKRFKNLKTHADLKTNVARGGNQLIWQQ